ncbi:hypothetical protein [Methylomonas rapida]|jgi:hypothetical protein|uniref:Type 4 fimbrial biogenesis protein PilX N-terminal domain-containing protein n=1 Tax=Methylomonas rapida TaxID=2963939 RepID=A0ABY7GPW3_9GAMM|nr:hypothetical protein [Methylomonas rapida]WAR46540.1 hypothetical protein NM686_008490 [Methylomonas rapida]
MNAKSSLQKQRGAASLLTALVLLICITLIALLTAKTVLVETQITADNYRTSQAFSAASAAMDRGVAYFMENGFDADGNNVLDYPGPGAEPSAGACALQANSINNNPFNFSNTNPTGTQTTFSQFYFDNTRNPADPNDICPAETPNMKRGIIVARGWSDDCTAVRTITQCVGTVGYFKNGVAPEQAWVSKAGVGVNGTGTIINRYTNTNVWAGGDYGGSSAAYDTYIRPADKQIADYTTAELDSATTANTQKVSDRNSGIGLDVITSDAFLSSKTSSTDNANLNSTAQNQFFDMYFSETKQGIKEMAEKSGQLYTTTTPPNTVSGLVWVEGDYSLPSLGSSTKPVTLIVNGDLTINGNIDFFGIVYVTGDIKGTGTPVITGSIIAEKTAATHSMSATSTLVFKPWGDGSGDDTPFQKGTGTVIAGTWKDW